MKNKILIFLLLFSFSAMSTEMEQAKKYYRARDYEKAYRIFHNLAEKGDPEAQLCVAIFLFIVLAKLTSVCYITRYANGKNKTTNRELRQIPAGIRTCCHTQKGLRRLLTFSMASTIRNTSLILQLFLFCIG